MRNKTTKNNSASNKMKETVYELIQKRNITLTSETANYLSNVQLPNDTKIRETQEGIHIDSKDGMMFSGLTIHNNGSMERYISFGLF